MSYRAVLPVMGLLLVIPPAQGGQWHYSIEYEPSYSSNIARTAENEREEFVHAWRVGLRYDDRSAVVEGMVNLDVEHLSYTNGVFRDQNRSYLNADLTWSLVRDRLFWVIEDTLSNEPVMSRQVWVPGNIQQTNLLSTGPRLSYRFDNGIHLVADLRYINSYAEITDEFNSNRLYLAGSVAQDLSVQTEISANLAWTGVDFDNREADDYRRLDIFAAWDWQQGHTGIRFELGGTRINFSFADQASGPLFRLTGNRQISSVSRLKVALGHAFSDAAQQITGDTRATPISSNIISSQVYTVSEVETSYRTEWVGSAIEATINYQRQNFLDSSDLDQNLSNMRLVWSKGFGASVSMEAGISLSRTIYELDKRKDSVVSPFVGFHFRRTSRLDYRLGVDWEERESTTDSAEYSELQVYAAVRYQH